MRVYHDEIGGRGLMHSSNWDYSSGVNQICSRVWVWGFYAQTFPEELSHTLPGESSPGCLVLLEETTNGWSDSGS